MPEIPIKYLKYIDNTGKVQKAYGITVLKAVYDTDGNTLDEILQTYDNKVGDTSSLTTTANTDLVSAINEVDGNVGDLSGLSTTAKNNLVAAVNELNQNMRGKTILSADIVSGSTSGAIESQCTSSINLQFSPVDNADQYLVIPLYASWATISNIQQNGTWITIQVINVGSTNHTITASVMVLQLGKIETTS